MDFADKDLNGVDFLESEDYLLDLKEELSISYSELKIICFKFVYDRMFRTILPYLEKGLADDALIDIHVDAIFSRYHITQGFSEFLKRGDPKEVEAQKNTREIFSSLKSKGAKITYYHEPSWINRNILPFSGRDHRKLVFIKRPNGERICYFGAVNFDEGGHNDFMLKITDSETLNVLENICDYNYFNSLDDDQIFKISDQLNILLDIGQNFKSKIQETGYSLIRNAKSKIIFVSQLPSEPPLLLEFIKARLKKVEVEIVIPSKTHDQVSGFPFILVYWTMLLAQRFFGIKILYCTKWFTHAKILIADDELLLGSHNLSSTGVAAGTVELSALIKNKSFQKKVEDFVKDLTNPNYLEEDNFIFNPNLKLLQNQENSSR